MNHIFLHPNPQSYRAQSESTPLLNRPLIANARQRRRCQGFTLVELLFAVFFIFAALGAIIVTSNTITSNYQHTEAAAQVEMLINATRTWGRQPSQNQNYTGATIGKIYCDGFNIAPFEPTDKDGCKDGAGAGTGKGQNTYGLDASVGPAANGARYQVMFNASDKPNCQALHDKFSVSAGVVTESSKCDDDGVLTVVVE